MTLALHSLAVLFAILAGCGFGYLVLTLWAIYHWRRKVFTVDPNFTPAVSILKPLKGADPEMYEGFRSHCLQDYPAEYEIIFGVNDLSDPAVAEVDRLKREFPHRAIRLVICRDSGGTNRKVTNLAQMVREARYEYVIINDSDIRVPPNYLSDVFSHFADPQVGMVTALYRGVPQKSIWSRVESMIIADFAGGILSALVVDRGIKFALGSTLAISKKVLAEIGGLEPLSNFLADDYELGFRTFHAGYRVALAGVVVETFLPAYSFRQMYEHQLRWGRTMRDLRKSAYAGIIFTYGLSWAIIASIFAGFAPWSLALLALVAVVRFLSTYSYARWVVLDAHCRRNLWLVPLRDAIGVVVFIASFLGNTVTWRGEAFRLKDGVLYRKDDIARQKLSA
ncbi:MAG: bacteriohopanetetrol glucosamine biosynthesis glycosyltransferase HpnI [Terriglobia bacterium]|jgi:ceramide glucosyltransferase|nr:bacteriohopanetetrol glucosamine biosynthesis glycosyltransferase HpnI [Terriglobia bacterium]